MLLRIALLFSIATPVLHVTVLAAGGPATSVHDPISALSEGAWGILHTLSLVFFGAAQMLLAVSLAGLDRGRFWPYGRGLLAVSGASVFFVAYYFATAEHDALQGPGANDPLWVVASLVGFAMGLLQPGLSRLSRRLGHFNGSCLVIWLLLIPAILLIGVISLGVYERTVGVVYVVWVAGVSYGAMRRPDPGAA